MLLELTMREQYIEGMEKGIETGKLSKLVEQCLKKLKRKRLPSEIAEDLEEDEALIRLICSEARKAENAEDPDRIAKELVDQLNPGN